MNLDIISIIQSCNTLHELKEEFKKPFGWFRFISKNKAKKLEDKLESTIKTILSKDEWDVQYLYDLERILLPTEVCSTFSTMTPTFPLYSRMHLSDAPVS